MRQVTDAFVQRLEGEDWVAVIEPERSWRASEVLAQARELAALLATRAGERPTVLVQSENSWRMTAAALAVGLLDGTLALASAHLPPADLAAVLEDVRPDVVVATGDQLGRWGVERRDDVAVLDGWALEPADGVDRPDRWAGGVVIGMTSGSTGRAKGVVHSEAALRYAVENEVSATGLQPGDAVGVVVPISAAPAFAFGVYAALYLQGACVLAGRWDPAAALRHLQAHQARWLMCVPTQVLQMAEAARDHPLALKDMRALTVGGGPMDVGALEEAEGVLGVPLLRVFGMAECLGHTTPALTDPVELRLGLDGRPFPGTEVLLLDDDSRPVSDGVPGRAHVRGPSRFLGYAREGVLVPPALTGDGYFETGDLIVRRPDGFLSVVGRTKDVVIRGGRNISVAEVESALRKDDRLRDVCVVPVADAVLGERVAAVVVLAGAPVTLAEVCARLAENGLAKTSWPEHLVTVDELPRTEVGKLSRPRVRAHAEAALQPSQDPGTQDPDTQDPGAPGSAAPEHVLVEYYRRLDGPQPLTGLDLVHPDLEFLIALPGSSSTGGRGDLAAYVDGRGEAGRRRRHNVLRRARDGDVEFVAGEILQDGARSGTFVGVVRLAPDGAFDRYLSLFETDVHLSGGA